MLDSPLPYFNINYKTIHSRCGNHIAHSDFRIRGLDAVHLVGKSSGSYKPLECYCHHCAELTPATHIQVVIFYKLNCEIVVKDMELNEFKGLNFDFESAYREKENATMHS